jgi:hypothetical protein
MKLRELLEKDIPFEENPQWHIIYAILEEFNLEHELNGKIDEMVELRTKKVYDVPHDSDESCFLYHVYLKGEFIAKVHKDGDRSSTYVEFYGKGKSDAEKYIRTFIEVDEEESHNSLDEDAFHDNGYIIPVHDTTTGFLYYRVDSPNWSYVFGKGVQVFVEGETELKPALFISFLDRRNNNKCHITMGNNPNKVELCDLVEIDARKLLIRMF